MKNKTVKIKNRKIDMGFFEMKLYMMMQDEGRAPSRYDINQGLMAYIGKETGLDVEDDIDVILFVHHASKELEKKCKILEAIMEV